MNHFNRTSSSAHAGTSFTRAGAIFLFVTLLILSAIPIQAVTPPQAKKPIGPSPIQAGVNPYKESLVSSHGANSGWRVPKGKISDIWYHPGDARSLGDDNKVLAGLSGLITQKPTITLSKKAEIKHEKIKPLAKYQSLVDALKEGDSQQKRIGRR